MRLPTGELRDAAARFIRQSNLIEQGFWRGLIGVEASQQVQDLGQIKVAVIGGGLELDSDAGLHLGCVGLHFQPQNADPAFRWLLKTLDDLQCGGLPGPIGAQYPKDLTPFNGKCHPVNRGEGTESFN